MSKRPPFTIAQLTDSYPLPIPFPNHDALLAAWRSKNKSCHQSTILMAHVLIHLFCLLVTMSYVNQRNLVKPVVFKTHYGKVYVAAIRVVWGHEYIHAELICIPYLVLNFLFFPFMFVLHSIDWHSNRGTDWNLKVVYRGISYFTLLSNTDTKRGLKKANNNYIYKMHNIVILPAELIQVNKNLRPRKPLTLFCLKLSIILNHLKDTLPFKCIFPSHNFELIYLWNSKITLFLFIGFFLFVTSCIYKKNYFFFIFSERKIKMNVSILGAASDSKFAVALKRHVLGRNANLKRNES